MRTPLRTFDIIRTVQQTVAFNSRSILRSVSAYVIELYTCVYSLGRFGNGRDLPVPMDGFSVASKPQLLVSLV